MSGCIIIHRQQGERSRGIEDLVGDMLVRLFVTEYGHDRLVIVFPARDVDPRSIARLGISPVGSDEQRCGELATVIERNDNPMISSLDVRHLRVPQQPYIL